MREGTVALFGSPGASLNGQLTQCLRQVQERRGGRNCRDPYRLTFLSVMPCQQQYLSLVGKKRDQSASRIQTIDLLFMEQ